MDINLSMGIPTQRYSVSRILIWIILFGVITIILYNSLPSSIWPWLGQRLSVFATVFLGTLSAGLVEVFLSEDWLARAAPRRALPAALVGASLGLIFPICECGTVPLARRLFRKGLPLPAGIAFLLAAPVLNPIVIWSTATAFGWGRMLIWRLSLSLLMAVSVGLAFSIEKDSANIMRMPIFKMELPVLDYHPACET